MMCFIYSRICIQSGIDHDPVDEVIDHGCDAVHTAEPIVEAGRVLGGHRTPSSSVRGRQNGFDLTVFPATHVAWQRQSDQLNRLWINAAFAYCLRAAENMRRRPSKSAQPPRPGRPLTLPE